MINDAIQRRLTKAFIDVRPVSLSLIPRERLQQPSGGTKWAELPARETQVFTLVEPSGTPAPVRTLDGKERVIEFMLVGEHDAELGVYDVFSHGGHEWEVLYLHYPNGWETRAEVARRG